MRIDLILTLRDRLAADPTAYASDDMRLCQEPGNKPAVAAFDLFVTPGVPREPPRRNSIVWREQAARRHHRVDLEDDQRPWGTLRQDVLWLAREIEELRRKPSSSGSLNVDSLGSSSRL